MNNSHEHHKNDKNQKKDLEEALQEKALQEDGLPEAELVKKGLKVDLTTGDVLFSLIKVALPIMGASFLSMAYNLTDMFWIGFNGSKSVAAVGIGGFYIWLSMSLTRLLSVGVEVKIAQRTGAGDEEGAEDFARNGMRMSLVLASLYVVFILIFKEYAIDFFKIPEWDVREMSIQYLVVVIFSLPFFFFSNVVTAMFNARGNSKLSLKVNAIGIVANMILDPIMILGIGNFQGMGVIGAAIATIIGHFIVSLVFYILIFKKEKLFVHFNVLLRKENDSQIKKEIVKMGYAPAIHNGLFAIIGMIIGRFVAGFGSTANAVQKLGAQIESISWMTSMGIGTALSAFVGQNFGAGKIDRVKAGYRVGIKLALYIGVFATVVLYFGAEFLISIFIREPESIRMGAEYLRIISLSQVFMTLEITGTGIFNGLGHTKTPAILGVVFNAIRIPIAYVFMGTVLGLSGIWWSLSLSTVVKGAAIYIALRMLINKMLKNTKVLET